MLSILSTLVPVFGIILFGIVVERMGFLPIETSGCLNQFVYWIGLPMMLFNQLARMEAGQMSGAMVGGILLGYGITYLFAYVVFSSLLRRRWEESSVFALLSSFPNAAFMGLPIVVLLLPDSSEAAIVASPLRAVLHGHDPLQADDFLAGLRKGMGQAPVSFARAETGGGAAFHFRRPLPARCARHRACLGDHRGGHAHGCGGLYHC